MSNYINNTRIRKKGHILPPSLHTDLHRHDLDIPTSIFAMHKADSNGASLQCHPTESQYGQHHPIQASFIYLYNICNIKYFANLLLLLLKHTPINTIQTNMQTTSHCLHLKMTRLITLLHGTERKTGAPSLSLLYQFMVSSYRRAPPSATWLCWTFKYY